MFFEELSTIKVSSALCFDLRENRFLRQSFKRKNKTKQKNPGGTRRGLLQVTSQWRDSPKGNFSGGHTRSPPPAPATLPLQEMFGNLGHVATTTITSNRSDGQQNRRRKATEHPSQSKTESTRTRTPEAPCLRPRRTERIPQSLGQLGHPHSDPGLEQSEMETRARPGSLRRASSATSLRQHVAHPSTPQRRNQGSQEQQAA